MLFIGRKISFQRGNWKLLRRRPSAKVFPFSRLSVTSIRLSRSFLSCSRVFLDVERRGHRKVRWKKEFSSPQDSNIGAGMPVEELRNAFEFDQPPSGVRAELRTDARAEGGHFLHAKLGTGTRSPNEKNFPGKNLYRGLQVLHQE